MFGTSSIHFHLWIAIHCDVPAAWNLALCLGQIQAYPVSQDPTFFCLSKFSSSKIYNWLIYIDKTRFGQKLLQYMSIRLLQKYWKYAKSATRWHSNRNYSSSTKPILKQSKALFASLFNIIILKPISYLSDKTRRKKLLKIRLTSKVECWPSFLNHSYQLHGK